MGAAVSSGWARGEGPQITQAGAHLRHRKEDARLGAAKTLLGLGVLLQDNQRLTSEVTALLHRRGSNVAPSRVAPPPFRQEAFARFRYSLSMRNVHLAVR